MTDDQVSDITMLYRTAINEFQNDEIQQINLEFYRILSKFIGKIKTEEYSGLEAKIKNEIFEKTTM
jgi:DNA replication factor GINS